MKHPKWVTRYREFMTPPQHYDPFQGINDPDVRRESAKTREQSRSEMMGSYASTYRQLACFGAFSIAAVCFFVWALWV